MSRANPGLLGWLFGRPRRAPARKAPARKPAAPKAPKPRKVPSIRTGRGPVGAATAKAATMRRGRGRGRPAAAPRMTERQLAQRRQEELLAKFERGTISGPELREFLKDARTARNPAAVSALQRAAQRQSETFHGKGFRDVVELTRAEQRKYALPRFVVPIGRSNAKEYVAPSGSQRAGSIWRHRSGDRGAGRPQARTVGYLVADPRTGRAVEVGGSERFKPSHGLVG